MIVGVAVAPIRVVPSAITANVTVIRHNAKLRETDDKLLELKDRFGRIGRAVLRAAIERDAELDVIAVNEATTERVFQRIANQNGGPRASGPPGYEASADYVAGRLRAAGAAGATSLRATMASRNDLVTRFSVYQLGRGNDPVIVVGSTFPAVALSMIAFVLLVVFARRRLRRNPQAEAVSLSGSGSSRTLTMHGRRARTSHGGRRDPAG
mgnify:CR=1 FL=1